MKIGDLVRTKDHDGIDDPFKYQYGLILEKNRDAAPSTDRSWHVFFYVWRKSIIMWEHEVEVISESTCK